MIVLTSNGLSSDQLLRRISSEVQKHGFQKGIIIVTADDQYKHRNWNVERISQELMTCGLDVELFDFDTDDAARLVDADVIEINGGNPFYLLDRMRKANIRPFLEDFVSRKKLLIGISAGSFVLQKNIELVNQYSSEMNIVGFVDLAAMDLVAVEILPHYDSMISKFDRFEERCLLYEQSTGSKVIRLNNGEAVIINGQIDVIRRIQQ